MSHQTYVPQLIRDRAEAWPWSETKVLAGLQVTPLPPHAPLWACPFLHVGTPQGQGEEVAGWGWKIEAKVRAEYDLGLNVLPPLPQSQPLVPAIWGGGEEEGDPAVCHCFTEAPVASSHQLFEEAAVISNYRAGTCSSEKEGDLPESPRELGAELGVEPRTVRLQRQALSMSCVCGAPVTLSAVCPWFAVSGRSNMACTENRALPMCMALYATCDNLARKEPLFRWEAVRQTGVEQGQWPGAEGDLGGSPGCLAKDSYRVGPSPQGDLSSPSISPADLSSLEIYASVAFQLQA